MSETKYYQIEFYYNTKGYDFNSEEAYDLLAKANDKVNVMLKDSGIKFRHAYMSSDGSLYKFVRCTEEQVLDLKALFSVITSTIRSINLEDPMTDPYKSCCKTLEEYFNKE